MPGTQHQIAVIDLTKSYGEEPNVIRALNHVNMQVHRGEFIVLLGPSGSGKSTLLHCLGGLDRADTGSIIVQGHDLSTLSNEQLSEYRRRHLGIILQDSVLLPHLTVLENTELPMAWNGFTDESRTKAVHILREVGMSEFLNRYPWQLSGGQRQRVALARALTAQPEILLADEPTGNLDRAARLEMMSLLRKLNRDRRITVLLVTHNEELVEPTDSVYRMIDGILKVETPTSALRATPSFVVESTTKIDDNTRLHWRWTATMGIRNALRAKRRTLLTVIGTAIGFGALVLTFGLATGVQNMTQRVVSRDVGSTSLTVTAKQPNSGLFGSGPAPLTIRDLKQIRALAGHGIVFGDAAVTARPVLDAIRNRAESLVSLPLSGHLPRGDRWVAVDATQPGIALPVSLLDASVAPSQIIGQAIKLKLHLPGLAVTPTDTVRVRGIYVDSASTHVNPIFMTQALMTQVLAKAHYPFVSSALIETQSATIANRIDNRLNAAGYSVVSSQDILAGIHAVFVGIEAIAGAFGAVSLIVAAVMIALVMVWSTLERTREIGILKVIGARPRDVQQMVLFEAAVLGATASCAGLLLGSGAGLMVAGLLGKVIHNDGAFTHGGTLFAWPWWLPVGTFFFGITISVIAAWAPAHKASVLGIVKSLRQLE